jgi:Tol biopolymer transport system component
MNQTLKKNALLLLLGIMAGLLCGWSASAEEKTGSGASPADHLPAYITRLTEFGERADWSHDGKRILFLEKTFGDVFEIELETKIIRPVTHHYYHEGYTRALYLANGDVLLSGAKTFDAEHPMRSRDTEAELWVLDKSFTRSPVRLGEKCSEGPAVSRTRMRIAWTIDHGDYPDRLKSEVSQIWVADIDYENATPRLVNKKLVLDSGSLPFRCDLETQNFRPPAENELTFSAYGYQGTEVMGLDLQSNQVTNYSEAPRQYDEPEGVFPDGNYTLVECDRQNLKGDRYIDIWKLRLDGSHQMERLTYFSDFEGYKASNPVVSDDDRYMAFQMGKSTDMAGVGHGIFLYDFEKAARGDKGRY